MTISQINSRQRTRPGRGVVEAPAGQRAALFTAVLGFFVITLDAVIVNVALPSIRTDLGGGVSGLQWIVDGYTLMFAALLLTAGSLTDRVGARRAFGVGLVVFLFASAACGFAPNIVSLVIARFVHGSAAAVMMPSSMALVRSAYPDAAARSRALAVWAMGGAAASSSGPVLGGVLTVVSWRCIFYLNLPVGLVALVVLARTQTTTSNRVPFDWFGQVTGVLAMGGLTYAAIEAGSVGVTSVRVIAAFAVAVAALLAFGVGQRCALHPMVSPALLRNQGIVISLVIGFAFMVGYYGLPFVFSLYFQQQRGLSALATGVAFSPMMVVGAALTPVSARIAERLGRKPLIIAGLAMMAVGLVVLGCLPASTPLWTLSLLMVLVGLGGPLVMPAATAVLLDAVPHSQSGTAGGVFNTARQVGGALAVAVFGALLASPSHFLRGVDLSLLIAGAIAAAAALASFTLPAQFPRRRSPQQ